MTAAFDSPQSGEHRALRPCNLFTKVYPDSGAPEERAVTDLPVGVLMG